MAHTTALVLTHIVVPFHTLGTITAAEGRRATLDQPYFAHPLGVGVKP